MGIARQLYQLQELDLDIDSNEQALREKTSQLGESQAVKEKQNELTSLQQRLDALKHEQRSAEWDIDDLTNKIKSAENQLYSGRITNPKELSNLQHEVQSMKARRDQLETRALELMEQIEKAEASRAAISRELEKLKVEWDNQQRQLSVEIGQLKSRLSDLKQNRQELCGQIDHQALDLYERLRKQKGQAVARVEQGICRGCRISLSSSEIQQARSGSQVQCSSCGRILYLP